MEDIGGRNMQVRIALLIIYECGGESILIDVMFMFSSQLNFSSIT